MPCNFSCSQSGELCDECSWREMGQEDGRAEERAAIVADLRREAKEWEKDGPFSLGDKLAGELRALADRYERGEKGGE